MDEHLASAIALSHSTGKHSPDRLILSDPILMNRICHNTLKYDNKIEDKNKSLTVNNRLKEQKLLIVRLCLFNIGGMNKKIYKILFYVSKLMGSITRKLLFYK